MHFNKYWGLPKNYKDFFNLKTEKQLKEKYGKLYTLHNIFSILILLLPFFILLTIAPETAFDPTTDLGNTYGAIGAIIGLVGSLLIGIGLVNIFMILIKQYLGHLVTLITIASGLRINSIALYFFSLVV